MCHRPRLSTCLLLSALLGQALPVLAQNGVFLKDGRLQRLSGSVFGSGVEDVPVAEGDRAAMTAAFQAVKPHCYEQSIFNLGPGTGKGACGRSTDLRAADVAGALPPGWRVDKVQSQDATNVFGGTGHVLLMLTSPDGNSYAMDTYMGVVEIAPLDKQTGYRWNAKSGEELAGVNATFAVGNFGGTLTYAPDGCHYVTTERGVEQYTYDSGSWIPNRKGDWYTPQIIDVGGPPPKPKDEDAGPVRRTDEVQQPVQALASYDPNHLDGPAGVGSDRFIGPRDCLTYTIGFENMVSASAPAAEVLVTDTLDPTKYDLATFQLGAIVVGDRTLTPPAGQSAWSTMVDLRPDKPLLLQVETSLDTITGVASWRFAAIEPATGAVPLDPLLGFLPPNATPPQGEGTVTFTVKPRTGLTTGSQLTQQARIVFDVNPPIDTNVWRNVVDAGAPSSHVKPLTNAPTGALKVEWEGSDDDLGSGIASYTVYVSKDGGNYAPWVSATTSTSAVYQGEYGRSYRFFSTASDAVGNIEGRLDQEGHAPVDARSDTGGPVVLPAGLNCLGLPVMPDQTDAQTLLGFTQNRWARWIPSAARYARYPAAEASIDPSRPGQAYWVTLNQSTTVTVAGRLADRTQPVSIPLEPGWNSIASPYLTALTWNTASILVATDDDQKTLALAAAAGWVSDYLWAWRNQNGVYQLICDTSLVPGASGQLPPWQGCWIKAARACRLLLPVPTGEIPASRRAHGATDWAATLRATMGGSSQQVVFGQSSGRATVISCPPAPPSGDNGLRLVLLCESQPAAVDVRHATDVGESTWDLAVSVPAGKNEVVLTWPSFLRDIPAGVVVNLVDSTAGVTRLLNTAAAYRFQPRPTGELRQLRLVARRGRVQRADVVSMAVRPDRGASVVVDLVLSAPAAVALTVRGPSGQLVRSLPPADHEAGTVSLAWDGCDQQARPVPAGVYVVEVTTTSSSGAVTRALRTARVH